MKLTALLILLGVSGYSQTTNLFVSNEDVTTEIGLYSLKTIPSDVKTELDVLLYPNPVNDFLNIKVNESIEGSVIYNVYDNKTSLIFSKKSLENSEIIDFTNLPSQIYFVEIKLNNKSIIKKIIKK
jgi:hypothetical protein